MYFEYLKERNGTEAIVKDYGFITYRVQGEECYLADVYVKPDFRSKSKSSELLNDLIARAKDLGCTMITAREPIGDYQSTHSLRCALSLGFEIFSANSEAIVIIKRI